MKMQFFKYELRYWLKNPSIYFYLLIFSGVALFYFIGSSDYFRDFEVTGRFTKWTNSTSEILYIFNYFNKFFLFLIPSIIGYSLYRDSLSNTHQIMYSFPITKRSYLFGKFGSTFLIAAAILSFVVLTYVLAKYFPGLNPDKIGPLNLEGFAYLLGFYILPNLLIYGLFVFSVIILTRNIYSGFGLIIALFFIKSIIENLAGKNPEIIALLDPLAQNSYLYVTQYWDAIQRNTGQFPLVSEILYNRLIWLSFSLVTFIFAYRKFEFHQEVNPIFNFKKAGKRLIKENFSNIHLVQLTKVTLKFDFRFQIRAFLQLVKSQVKYIFRSPLFLVMTSLALLTIIFMITKITALDAMSTLPETRIILSFPSLFFKAIVMLLVFLYSGMLIRREQKSGISELVDVVPVPTSILMLSKFISIVVMQGALLLCIMVSGMVLQIFHGYYEFEIGLYLQQLLGLDLISMTVWTMMAFFIHSFLKNTFVGSFLLLGFWVLTANLDQLGVVTNLFSYNKAPMLMYSNMNGYGHDFGTFLLLESYWFAFGLGILVVSYLLFNRGLTVSIKDRLSELKFRVNLKVISLLLLSVVTTTFLGFKIYTLEQQNEVLSPEEMEEVYEQYQSNFSKYDRFPQPRIIATRFEIAIQPKQNSFEAKGYHVLQNKTNQPIDTLLVKCGYDEITELEFANNFEVVKQDDNFQFYVLKLTESLAPNDSIRLAFTVQNKKNTRLTRNSNVIDNGTFIKQDIFPRIGYQDGTQTLPPEDVNATANHAYNTDCDAMYFDALISTNSSQTALAAGKLVNHYVKGDRAFYHYKTESPIVFLYGIHSGNFEKYQEEYKGVNLEIWYHSNHYRRLPSMMQGLKASLDYNTKHFSDYQHHDARIIEFPTSEGGYATTIGNTIPISEMRFSEVKGSSDDGVDLAFYIPAHELTHQWWGAQLLPANAHGARMLSESITEYITFNIYRSALGEEEALQFLRLQRKRYLKRLRWSKGIENPLIHVQTNQKHIFYGKGSMAFHALGHVIGEEQLTGVLKDYLECYNNREAPYATSTDFISFLKEETPDSLEGFIGDWFEKQVMHEVKFDSVNVVEQADGNYQINMNLLYYKEVNKDTLYSKDWLECEITYEDESREVVQLKCDQEKLNFSFQRAKKPKQLRLDPNLLLMEKDIDGNVFLIQ